MDNRSDNQFILRVVSATLFNFLYGRIARKINRIEKKARQTLYFVLY
jgi:hypothetical protein